MGELIQQDADKTIRSGLLWMATVGGRPLSDSANESLRRAIEAACAPGRYDPQAPEATPPVASMRTAPISAAPLSSPAHPAPLARTGDYDLGADQVMRQASFALPLAVQPLAAPPAPNATSQLTDYEKGEAHFRELLGKTARSPRSSPAHPAPPAPDATSWLTDYEKGEAHFRALLGKTA